MVAVRACRYVDLVVVNRFGEDSKPTIAQVAPSHIVHGDDWTGPDLMAQMGLTDGWLAERGIEFLYLPYTEGISSSDIEQRILHRGSHVA
jgi:glycerol-3-phosphate cytidylyltransferase-like family protein